MPAARKIFKNIFLILTAIAAFFYLLSCLIPYLNPSTWWFMGFLGLAFPYLALVLFFALLFWLITKPKYALIPLAVLLIGYKQLSVVFAFNASGVFNKTKSDNIIRIADFNVRSFNSISNNKTDKRDARIKISELLHSYKPDVICMQEFNHSYTQGPQADNISLFSNKYPYNYFSKDFDKRNGFYVSGCIIFSKYPIVNTGKVIYKNVTPESLIYADILKGIDTIRVYTTHLQSFQFKPEDYEGIEKIKEQNANLHTSMSLAKKMKLAFINRGAQARIVKEELDKNSLPSIICGDFNDVPNSYAYFHIRGKRKDAFLEKGFGLGRTYISIAPTLRIDNIFPDDNFSVKQFELIDQDLSDHLLLITDLELNRY